MGTMLYAGAARRTINPMIEERTTTTTTTTTGPTEGDQVGSPV